MHPQNETQEETEKKKNTPSRKTILRTIIPNWF